MLSYYSYPKNRCFSSHLQVLTGQEFDDIYNKKIAKKYKNHEIKWLLCKQKENRKRKIGAIGRHFKLDLKDRFLMLLVYYRLYITYTLAGFLSDLDQSNICRDTKRLNIEYGMRMLPIPQKIYPIKQRVENSSRGSRTIFSRLSCFYRLDIEQQIPRPIDKSRRKMYYADK